MAELHFHHTQRPVGQGGFHLGWIDDLGSWSKPPFDCTSDGYVWVYDCGSDRRAPRHRELELLEGVRVNTLFLSHLDRDHVAGVDHLLLTTSLVEEVVLPYLDEDEWVLHLAAAAATGDLSSTFVELVSDPAAFFGSRGVKRIIYVQAQGDEGETVSPDPIEPSDFGPRRGADAGDPEKARISVSGGWSRDPEHLSASSSTSVNADVLTVPPGALVSLSACGLTLNWVLAPFAFRPPVELVRKFKQKLAATFGANRTVREYADTARTAEGRRRLRSCYDNVWTTHNLHSMALYAGPVSRQSSPVYNTAWHSKFVRRIVAPGWLSTGDFDFTVDTRRLAFLNYYDRYASLVGQLTLSHHGSDLSFDPSVLDAFSNLSSAIAAVGVNSHRHPGQFAVQTVAAMKHCAFVRVDENPDSSFLVSGRI